jgi:hypothetical protein
VTILPHAHTGALSRTLFSTFYAQSQHTAHVLLWSLSCSPGWRRGLSGWWGGGRGGCCNVRSSSCMVKFVFFSLFPREQESASHHLWVTSGLLSLLWVVHELGIVFTFLNDWEKI